MTGQPANGSGTSLKKRKHYLSLSINKNVPNAKKTLTNCALFVVNLYIFV